MRRRIDIEGRFDLRSTVRMVKAGSVDSAGVWSWSTSTADGPATVVATFNDGSLSAEAWGPGAEALLERLPDVVGIDDRTSLDLESGPVKDLLKREAGTRLGASGAVFEATAIAILGQLVTRAEATRSRRMLVSEYGEPAPGPKGDLSRFPDPDRIAALSYEELHRIGVERNRASTLIEAARRAKRLEEILDMDRDAAYARLQAVRGVGPWTSAFVMGIAWGDKDAVPTGDYHLPNTVTWALAGEPRGDDVRMVELLEPYRPERRRILLAIKAEGIHAPKYGPKSTIRRHL
jgi:3-methyladenine DNA glycosylase/8-oxoguanine DNA glycosylase